MWIEVFKTGTHKDSSGHEKNYSAEMLEEIVRIYNSSVAGEPSNEAPIVKGHPQNNEPAYGWVERLARNGTVLLAKLKNLSEEIIDEVQQGKYRRVSIALYPDMMLRHIGLLGAVPPSVDGLDIVKFSASSAFEEYEINNETKQSEDEELKQEIELERELNERINSLEALVEQYIEENTLLKERIQNLEKQARIKEHEEFVNSLIENEEGSIITPSQAEELIELMEMAHQMDSHAEATNEYCKGRTYSGMIKSFFAKSQPVFSTQEFARKKSGSELNYSSTFQPNNVSPEKLKIHQRAMELQAQTPSITYEDAVALARKEE